MAIIKVTQGIYPNINHDQHTNNRADPWKYEQKLIVNGRTQLIIASGSVHGAIFSTSNPPPNLREIGFIIRIMGKQFDEKYKISIQEQRYNGVAVHVSLPMLQQEISLEAGDPYELSVEPLPGTACEPTADVFSIFIYD